MHEKANELLKVNTLFSISYGNLCKAKVLSVFKIILEIAHIFFSEWNVWNFRPVILSNMKYTEKKGDKSKLNEKKTEFFLIKNQHGTTDFDRSDRNYF